MKVSVVVPLYNDEQRIARCIFSLLDQDFDDYEIIIVDDGSSDRSFETANRFQSKKVKVFSKANGGPSSARNYGITKCSKDSEYLFFVDSDDTVVPNYISAMLKYASQNRLVVCDINHLDEANEVHVPHQLKAELRGSEPIVVRDIWNNEEFIHYLPSGIFNPSWNKCYSLSLIHKANIKFEQALPEDIRFNIDYMLVCDEVCFVEDKLYNYIHRPKSLTGRPMLSLFESYMQIQKELYALVAPKYHCIIDEFVYPQYLANTKRYLYAGDFITPRRYVCNPLIKKAISSHRATCFGDWLIKHLFKYAFFNLLVKIEKCCSH